MTQLSKIARWDKLKSWKALRDEIEDRLNSADKFDEGITLDIGPQLLYTLRHPSALRCMEHTSSKLGEVFTCHYNKGAVQGVRIWLWESKGKDGVCKNKGFETECEITCMTYVSKHRVYLVFCSDLTLRVITDARSNFVEVDCIPCLTTTLCLVYNKEDDEIYAGGIGSIEEWKVSGAEHAASLIPGRKFFTDLTRNDWIRDIKIVKQNNHIIAQHGNGLCVVHFKTRKQMHRLPNRHEGPMTCCCYYPQNDFLITGGSEGKIRVFNGTAFNLLHVFIGHHGAVSAMEPHRKDALLFSSSHDGTVRIWRMDSLQIFMRLDIGEKIYHMSLLGATEFYFHTEKDVMIYNCNQFYQFFAPVESESKRLMCCRGKDRPNRILASTEDGSVRLFSPITGLTLTIIYPMPSFQVLMSFAYDIHQDRLHTVLTGGKVIVYNTATNPCKAEEVWVPSCEDEHVNILLLITVEFPCDDGTDLDNLVFAGLTNGQIILCDAVVCSLECPVQAHEGAVTSLESCLHPSAVGHFGSGDTASMIISGGTDKFVKVWKIQIDVDGRRPVVCLSLLLKVYLLSVPLHICMYSSNLWVSIKTETKLGTRWKLMLNKLVQISSSKTEASQRKRLLHSKYVLMSRQLTHSEDEDHAMELTSLDKCPIMNVVMTSGKDGFVKMWSSENELLREMNFATPIYASCFANDRGDILVGFGTHICSVSVVNYLPLEYLKQVANVSKFCVQDDIRELPVKFDHQSQPWLDISKLRQYSVDIFDRRRQRLEEEVIERLKKATVKEDSTKFVIFVDGKTTKVIRKDFADKLLSWAKGKNKLKFGVKTAEFHSLLADASSETENTVVDKLSLKKKDDILAANTATKPGSSIKEEKKVFFDAEGLLEIYPSAVGKALKVLGKQRDLGPEEMRLLNEQELLKKDPIIAPDGYIPNSVIRRKLKPPKVDVPLRRLERPFQLKPVPKVNPQHMPSWWGTDDERERATPRREYRVMKWDDTPSPPPKSVISSVSSVSLKSLIESPVKKYIAEGRSKTTTPRSPKSKSEQKNGTRSVAKSRNDTTPVENMKKMIKANNENIKARKSGWDDSSPSERTDTEQMLSRSKPTSGMSDTQRSSTNLSETSIALKSKLKPGTPTTYKLISPNMLVMTPLKKGEATSGKSRVSSGTESGKVKSKRIELSRLDLEMSTPDSARRGRRSGARSEAREKSFKLTNYAVDEDSSAIHVKETKSGRRLKSHMSHVIIKQLLEEEWMPEMEGDFDYSDVIDSLVTVLDNQNNPIIFDSACTYIVNLFKELGMTDEQLDQILGKLGVNLDNMNSAIKKYTLRTLQTVGQGRNDVLVMILEKLVDPEEPIRRAAAEAIRVLTGATDKETLLNILENTGITSASYRSKPDEEYTLAMLAEKFGEHEDPQVFERILNWVEGTTPGMFDDDREDEDALWQEGSRSRKEHSFMSEGKSGKKDGPLTPRSRGTTSTFKRRMKETDGFSTISDRSSSSRKSRRSGSPSNFSFDPDDDVFFQPNMAINIRTPTRDIGRRNSSRVDNFKLRQDTQSDLQSRTSTEHGLPLPYTLPSQARDSWISGTPSSRSQLKVSMKVSPRDILQETPENVAETSRTDVTATTETSKQPVETPQTIKEEEKVEPVIEKAKTASTEHTTVSIDTNTGSIETQPISKGTPANTPESPTAMNELPVSTQDALVTIENQRMEPISEDLETASFLKTPRAPESAVPMESTALDEQSVISKETEGKKDDVEEIARLDNDQGTTTPSDPAALDIRFTPKDPHLFKYYGDQQDTKQEKQFLKDSEGELEHTAEKIQDRDSDYQTISHIASSRITDRLSGYDSGIAKDMSEYSHGRAFCRGFPHAPLSPVKSESASPAPHSGLQSPKDWRKFFDLVPNAQERKQMEQIRREMEQGKLKHATLPPISYFAQDLPMLPGEAGTRLLQTVRVGEKMQVPGDGRHRIESVPGKLAVHTQNEDAGLSNFGIIQMQWTTGVPTVKDLIHPPQQIPQHRSHRMIRSDESELNSARGLNRMRHGISEEELNLPYLDTASPALTHRHSPNQYEWEFPLPPPPPKESRTEVPQIRKDHESYCKYYHLVKKKLHLYTSPLGFIPALIAAEKARPKPKQKERTQHLPELFVKRLREEDKQQYPTSGETLKKKRSLTKMDIKSSVMFPPIKLGQLVKIC